MKWVQKDNDQKIPIKSWCETLEPEALQQAKNLASHPILIGHVALMPDTHVGYGMPIGGVIACKDAVIPNAVGVDIGCGMCAIQTDYPAHKLQNMKKIRSILDNVKKHIPVGEAHAHKSAQHWDGFNKYAAKLADGKGPNDFSFYINSKKTPWLDRRCWELAVKNLGSLGGGNHFIELQRGDDGNLWLMLHSGSRNLGYRIANHYHKKAQSLNEKEGFDLPCRDLAYLSTDSDEGQAYIRDMTFALEYAKENRHRMMNHFKAAVKKSIGNIVFTQEINIHHNYAALEEHFGYQVWVHRKGATSAQKDELGIIPGSMGTPSYIVKGLGNEESFSSCSHGAGRVMGRKEACRKLSIDDCNKAMEGIVFDRWRQARFRGGRNKGQKLYDLEEAPQAYKNIEVVINSELDLITPLVKLFPIGVIKG